MVQIVNKVKYARVRTLSERNRHYSYISLMSNNNKICHIKKKGGGGGGGGGHLCKFPYTFTF